MGKKMLIDAAHREETRVAVVSGNRVENFDFESAAKKPLRGNIYLAKVTRVEPSLQAAFVEYGGNRHGFLAFSEIHPDYYQIPVADREKLLAAEAEEARAEAFEDDEELDDDEDNDDVEDSADDDEEDDEAETASSDDDDDSDDDEADDEPSTVAARAASGPELSEPADDDSDDEDALESASADIEEIEDSDEAEVVETASSDDDDEDDTEEDDEEDDNASDSEAAASGDDGKDEDEKKSSRRGRGRRGRSRRSNDEKRPSRRSRVRSYKIQEVIKRRQILLVQVVKEERGNKGAALTTYLSLAGRYCVLMPNTARGGGISRKITNPSDRRRLKEATSELEVPEGMGLIVRTAGANRTKAEIKRDYDYLLRLWENIRDLTLKSSAPALIYEEGDLIKRSIRDLYSKDIDEIQVDGDEAYKDAKEFMRMLMPSHAKNVKRYKEREALFQRYGVESELDSLLDPTVTLKSGGYIVINPTEALVSIDVNSGKSTKEHNIEATALSTNMEAAEEISRQLRLRDLAGLIVIDFIDMEEPRNNRSVERRLKDSLKQDRARIQVGRISSFGLLEMSRQRMRSGVLEGSTDVCPHCKGTGHIRSVESTALHILRAIEAEALKGKAKGLDVTLPTDVAVYILNQKRTKILEIEARCRVSIYLLADASLVSPDFTIRRTDDREAVVPDASVLSMESAFEDIEDAEEVLDAQAEAAAQEEEEKETAEEDRAPRKRRRRRRRKPSNADTAETAEEDSVQQTDAESDDGGDASESDDKDASGDGEDGQPRKRRRRGRRGGRRHRRSSGRDESDETQESGANAATDRTDEGSSNKDSSGEDNSGAGDTDDAGVLIAYSARNPEPMVMAHQEEAAEASAPQDTDAKTDETVETAETAAEAPAPLPVEEPAKDAAPEPETATEPEPEPETETAKELEPVLETELESADSSAAAPAADDTPPKRGWWQRRSS